MKVMTNETQNSVKTTTAENSTSDAVTSYVGAGLAYNEMSDFPVSSIDPVEQVQKNLQHIQELHAKMRFMMRELRYLVK